MSTATVRLDAALLALLGDSPEAVDAALQELAVLELFRRAAISGGRAARLLGMERLAFMRLASSRGIPVIDMSPEEWQEELRRIRSL